MSLTLFKLSKPGGPTRRLTFPNKPSWSLLASKIESLYGIPFSKVGVSYIDNDGDEVTLSSEDELNDFYEVSYIAPQPIKFTVQDLRSLRESGSSRPLPETPRASGNLRNTFGGLFDIDDDWQLPGLTTMFRPSDSMTPDSPHAYLEMVESDMTRTDDKASSIGSDLVDINPNSPEDHQDKGKGKSYEPSIADTISSTGSVLAEDAPPKHPLHVYDMSSHGHDTKPNLIPINQGSDSSRSTVVNAPTGNTSKAANIEPPSAAEGARLDPVAPSLGTPAQTFEHPSISNDFATLLNAFTNVVSSHPELSEAARNIMLNVTSGAYWKHHRETISRGAEEILRTAQEETGKTANDIRRTAEEEAGKRVSAALDAIMRAFSDMGGHGGESAAAASPVAPTTENAPDSQPTEAAGKNSDPLPPPPPPSVPFKPWHSWHHPPSGPPHSTEWYRASPSRPWLMPHPPPHVPPPGFGHVRPLFPPLHPGPPPLGFGHPPPFAPPPQSFTNRPSSWISDPNPQDLKAKVELAKLKYKTEKEHYRAHRAHRKEMQRRQLNQTNDSIAEGDEKNIKADTKAASDAAVNPATTQIVSNAHGPYPQVEMFSVPATRGRDQVSPLIRRHGQHGQPEDVNGEARLVRRISTKLADMGFMESTYPSIPTKIKSHVPPTGHVTKEAEDDIVTTLLEELLVMSPQAAVASGSNLRNREGSIPGAWR